MSISRAPVTRLSCVIAFTLAMTSIASAQPTRALEEVTVKGQLLRPQDSTFTATVLSGEEIREHAYAEIDDLFRHVPGMAVRDLQLGSVASSIVIRGFGGGGHGGDLGAVIDGIPLNEAMSHADGYVDLNTVIPLEIDSFTVLKGPVSALYGNFNRGGLVNIQTRKSGDYAQTDATLGADDTSDFQAAYGSAIGTRHQVNAAGRVYRTDGFRPHSGTEHMTLAGRWSMAATDRLDVALSSRWLQANSDSASYLTRAQYEQDFDGIDARTQNDGAEKDFLTLRLDANYELDPSLKLLTFAYTTEQSFTRWFSRPVSASTWRQREETYDRTVFGAGTSLNGVTTFAAVPLRYIAGIESFRESTEFKFFDGLDQRRRLAAAQSNRDTALNSISAFTEMEADVHPLAQVSIGARADRFTGGCERLGEETGSDPCGSLNQATHVSPKFGLRSRVTDWLQVRASWAEGFALPNGYVKYSLGGQPLDETVFRQTEVGAHLELAATLAFDVAAYRLTSDGEVRNVSPGVYENYGATERRGVEASVTWQPIDQIGLHAVYGVSNAEVVRNADARLTGRDVPGVPQTSARVEARVTPVHGWTLSAAWRYAGDYQVDALNTLQADSYALMDVGLAWVHDSAHSYRLYAQVDNVTDERYATSVSLIGGQELLAPGAPRTWRAGIQYNF